VTVTKDAFAPKHVKMNATEGLIFVAEGAHRITLELEKPAGDDDRPKPRWTNPRLIWKDRAGASPAGRGTKRAK
jgi:hypothetical protein